MVALDVSRVLSGANAVAIISLEPPLPTTSDESKDTSSTRPAPSRGLRVFGIAERELLALARGGVCHSDRTSPCDPVRSYRTFSPLLWEGRGSRGRIERQHDTLDPLLAPRPSHSGLFSVALSLTWPSPAKSVGVTHHRVLSCSDFPPRRHSSTERSPFQFQYIRECELRMRVK